MGPRHRGPKSLVLRVTGRIRDLGVRLRELEPKVNPRLLFVKWHVTE